MLVKDEDGENVIYEDETKLRSKGRDGYVVEAYLITFTDGVETDRTRVSRDTYRRQGRPLLGGRYAEILIFGGQRTHEDRFRKDSSVR